MPRRASGLPLAPFRWSSATIPALRIQYDPAHRLYLGRRLPKLPPPPPYSIIQAALWSLTRNYRHSGGHGAFMRFGSACAAAGWPSSLSASQVRGEESEGVLCSAWRDEAEMGPEGGSAVLGICCIHSA